MAGEYDGSLKFDTKVNTKGFNDGTKNITSQMGTLVKSIKAVGVAIAGSFVVKAIKSTIDAAEELQNAMTGLKSIMDGQGKSFSNAQKFITQYTEDGLIPASNAITAYKNLALRGYNTEQIEKVMTALKDSATYGRQSAYSLGEAVQSASEGLKNENSILVDNAGVTKNVAKMWDEYAKSIGKTSNNLTQQEKIEAEVNGILQETKFQTGDAVTYMNSYSGQVARLNQQWLTFKQTIGTAFMTLAQAVLPVINSIMSALIKLASVFKSVITTLFGKLIKTNNNVTKSATKASNAVASMGDSAEEAGKQANEALAPFDELNVLQQETGSSSASDTGTGGGVDIEDIGDIEIDTSEIEEIPTILQKVIDHIENMLSKIKSIFEPTIKAWSETFKELWVGVQPIMEQFKRNLGKFYVNYLLELVNFTIFRFIAPIVNAFSEQFAPIFGDYLLGKIQLFSDTFENFTYLMTDLLNNTFIPALTQLRDIIIAVMPTIMEAMQTFFDLSLQVGDYVLNQFLFPLIETITETLVPIFTDILSAAIVQFSLTFKSAIDTIKSIWDNILKPVFEQIKTIFIDVMDSIKNVWDERGTEILNGVQEFMSNMRTTWNKLYTEILLPIIQPFLEKLSKVWDEHIKGVVEQVIDFVAKLTSSALQIYNEVVVPIRNWLIDVLAPIFKWVFDYIGNVVSGFLETLSDMVSAILRTLGGVIDFVTGVFTGDWERAWNGVKDIFGGIWDGIIGMLKGVLNGIIDAINSMIDGINNVSFNVPDWVPVLGGEHVGLNVPKIPRLATGAVIPPNAEFTAVLGDQKNGRNLEAPESLIRQIVREETEALANRPIYTKVEISGKTLMDIISEQEQERERAYGYDTGGGSFAY